MIEGKDYIGIGVGAMIFNDKGEVLLMRRGVSKSMPGMWIIPGGKVDFNETLSETVIRETREEIGIEIEIDGQLPAFDHILKEEKEHWVTSIFTARIVKGTPKNMEPEKCDEVGWFALASLPSPIAAPAQYAFDTFLNI